MQAQAPLSHQGRRCYRRHRITIGNGDQMEPAVLKATPLGLLGTEAVVRIGTTEIRGSVKAMRRLAGAACEAADLAEAHDREREEIP